MSEVRLLGPVELWRGGDEHGLGSLKERGVLSVLALDCGHPVPTDALIHRLWDRPPSQARENLTSYVSRLRGRLRVIPVSIVSGPGTYTLSADPEIVDLHRFRRLERQAGAIAASGDDEHAVALLREAEALWRGEALAGLPGDWLQRMRESLHEEHRAVVLRRIETELRLGHHADVIGELHRLAARYPLDERVTAQLMVALYRCDRQADALRTYRETRSLLVETLGSDPGPPLQDVYQRILRADIDLAVTPRYHLDQASQPDTLPPDLTDFTGREREVAELTDETSHDGTSIQIIAGMPGVGKTALAVHVAHRLTSRYPDAALLVNLSEHGQEGAPGDSTQTLGELLRMLGVAQSRIPPRLDDRADLWRREMADRRAVLVIDDAVDTKRVLPLLPNAPGCRVLLTTRHELHGIPDSHRIELDVLSAEEATTLFARVVDNAKKPDHEVVAKAVQLCGGLPIAIRVAAGRLADRSVGDGIAPEHLGIGGTEPVELGGPEVRAVFDLSHRHLTADQRRVFRRLGLHPGEEITDNAAAALDGSTVASSRAAIDALVDDHLLQTSPNGTFRFHDLVRDYARERAVADDSTGDRRRAIGRLLDYYLAGTCHADRMLYPPRRSGVRLTPPKSSFAPVVETSDDAGAWIDLERRNLLPIVRYAVTHEWKKEGSTLAYTAFRYLETKGYWEEASAMLDLALHACREIDDREQIARVSGELGFIRFRTGDYATALHYTNEALAIHRSRTNRPGEAGTLDRIGLIFWSSGRFHESLAYYQEALALYRAITDPIGQADVLAHSGVIHWHLGRYDEAIAHLRTALAIFKNTGDRRSEAQILNNIGDMQQVRGYHRDAIKLYQESFEIFKEITGRQGFAILENNTGNVHQYKGEHLTALQHYRSAIATFRETGDRRNTADVLNNIGATYHLMDRHSEALVHHQKAHETAVEIADPYERARAALGLADAHRGIGNYPEATRRYQETLAVTREIGDVYQQAKAHDGMAGVALHTKGREAARIHWRQALDLLRGLDVPEARTIEIRLHSLGGMAS